MQRWLRNTLFAATQRDKGCQASAGAFTANADSGRVSAQFGGVSTCPFLGRNAVIDRSRGLVFRCEPVVHRQHVYRGVFANHPTQSVVGFDVAHNKTTAVEEEK